MMIMIMIMMIIIAGKTFIKSEVTATHSHTFSRAFRQPHAFTSSFDWFPVLCVSFVTSQSDYFGLGFKKRN